MLCIRGWRDYCVAWCETLADEAAFAWLCLGVLGRQRVTAMRSWCLCHGFCCAVARVRRVVVGPARAEAWRRTLVPVLGCCVAHWCGAMLRCGAYWVCLLPIGLQIWRALRLVALRCTMRLQGVMFWVPSGASASCWGCALKRGG